MSKPRKTLSLKGITPEQEALITRQETPRIERIEKEEKPEPDPIDDPPHKEKAPEPAPKKDEPKIAEKAEQEPKPVIKPDESESEQKSQKKKGRKRAPAKSPVSDEVPEPWITKTYRLPGSLIERLQMVSLERRIKKVIPNTQQELLAQALTEWLERNED